MKSDEQLHILKKMLEKVHFEQYFLIFWKVFIEDPLKPSQRFLTLAPLETTYHADKASGRGMLLAVNTCVCTPGDCSLSVVKKPSEKSLARYSNTAEVPQIRTTKYGLNSFRSTATKLWNSLPQHFRDETNLSQFRSPKTIFFWAPTMKWCLVIAGIGDIARPAEKLSQFQSSALAATGLIWSRYSLVITPKNYNLFAVNVFVGATGLYQLYRIYKFVMEEICWPTISEAKGPMKRLYLLIASCISAGWMACDIEKI
ncbi:MPC2-like protein [Mya arenaria]|uniref:Mitochondrial pyruvate carrier n=1 Tax=Mya arenaria TaxID=6604 RepID=A0ABY7ECG5_MYAAR|nr:MPC2-like protein [Mya arenaria]